MAQLKVLAVDDDDRVCEYLRDLLEPDGCAVTTIGDPASALQTLRTHKFHILTLDLHMPEMSGMELLVEIRKVEPDIAVIILTGYPSIDTATDAINLDVSAYVKKPFSGEELRETIARVARKKGIVVRREDELHVTIGDNLRNVRRARNLTLKDLGQRTGLSASQLSQIERAESSASVSTLFRVATALDLTITDLLDDF